MMPDTRGLRPEHIGQRLRIEDETGSFAEIRLLELNICGEGGACCGITYRLLFAAGTAESRKANEVYWIAFQKIKSYDVVGD